VATGSTVTTSGCGANAVSTADVFLLAGGYDTNEDNDPPTRRTASAGRFSASIGPGAVISNLTVSPATHSTLGLTHPSGRRRLRP
jgi:hypothetical protein